MIGAVIIAHGSLASGLLEAAEAITGNNEEISLVSVGPDVTSDEVRERLENAVKDANSGDGVIVFTDMFGGTPTNIALSFLSDGEVEILTGVNLPIIIKFLHHREEGDVSGLVGLLRTSGHESIASASEMLKLQD